MSFRYEKLPVVLDTTYLKPNVTNEMVILRKPQVDLAYNMLTNGSCPSADFTGWIEPDKIVSDEEMKQIHETAKKLREETDVLVVIGIGGSYLGARAVIEALSNDVDRVMYAGQNISAHYKQTLMNKLKGKKVAINVVSKSGTTTEPAVAFRVLKDLVPREMQKDWIVATTDKNKGALLEMSKNEGYKTFVVPDDVGGRYSVLSAVGLLPIAYAGIDIDKLVGGAKDCSELCSNTDPLNNPAFYYAAARNIMYQQGFSVELFATFEPRLHYFAEWWKQLYGESEGKQNSALFPASVEYTTDLHSLGQYVQEGRRFLFETFIIVDEGEPVVNVPKFEHNLDGLNYLAGKEVSYINKMAYEATARAHRDGGVPNMTIMLKSLDAYTLGSLIYFFEIACGVSGLMLGVNPFNQPGVEAYKNIMFELLGKPGANQTGCVDLSKPKDVVGF